MQRIALRRPWTAAGMLVVLAAIPANTQQKPKEPVTLRQVLLEGWNDSGNKVVQLAENFPDEKYEFKPTAGVRTFADTLRHVAFWNDWVTRTARGEKVDGKPNELPRAEYATKAQIVGALKKIVGRGRFAVASGPRPSPRGGRSLDGIHCALGRTLWPARGLLPSQRPRPTGIEALNHL